MKNNEVYFRISANDVSLTIRGIEDTTFITTMVDKTLEAARQANITPNILLTSSEDYTVGVLFADKASEEEEEEEEIKKNKEETEYLIEDIY